MNTENIYTYLALGDSYTIGEGVPLYESYPYQVVQRLRSAGFHFHAPEILAKTGWTTSELADAISQTKFETPYDFVTLLIGVDNQYRGLALSDYQREFRLLLGKAIEFAAGNLAHVAVISIPDWSVTPFATGRDQALIRREIDRFNESASRISAEQKIGFLDITPGSREAASRNELLATDGLHPSGLEYGKWAKKIYEFIFNQLQ